MGEHGLERVESRNYGLSSVTSQGEPITTPEAEEALRVTLENIHEMDEDCPNGCRIVENPVLEQLRYNFDKMDADRSGSISEQELVFQIAQWDDVDTNLVKK